MNHSYQKIISVPITTPFLQKRYRPFDVACFFGKAMQNVTIIPQRPKHWISAELFLDSSNCLAILNKVIGKCDDLIGLMGSPSILSHKTSPFYKVVYNFRLNVQLIVNKIDTDYPILDSCENPLKELIHQAEKIWERYANFKPKRQPLLDQWIRKQSGKYFPLILKNQDHNLKEITCYAYLKIWATNSKSDFDIRNQLAIYRQLRNWIKKNPSDLSAKGGKQDIYVLAHLAGNFKDIPKWLRYRAAQFKTLARQEEKILTKQSQSVAWMDPALSFWHSLYPHLGVFGLSQKLATLFSKNPTVHTASGIFAMGLATYAFGLPMWVSIASSWIGEQLLPQSLGRTAAFAGRVAGNSMYFWWAFSDRWSDLALVNLSSSFSGEVASRIGQRLSGPSLFWIPMSAGVIGHYAGAYIGQTFVSLHHRWQEFQLHNTNSNIACSTDLTVLHQLLNLEFSMLCSGFKNENSDYFIRLDRCSFWFKECREGSPIYLLPDSTNK